MFPIPGRKALPLLLLPCLSLLAACERLENDRLDASAESARLDAETEALLEGVDAATLRSGGGPCAWPAVFPLCASVDTSDVTYPDTTVLVFDPACTGLDGRNRTGTIRVILSDAMDVPGAVRTVVFEGFGSGAYSADGTVRTTYTGTDADGNPTYGRDVDLTWSAPAGTFVHAFDGNVTWLSGHATPECLDNVWEITGGGSVVTPWGTLMRTITTPLIVDRPCGYTTAGTVDVEGPYGERVIDFGDGTCDDEATVTLSSGATFTLDLDDYGWRRRR